MEYGRIWSRFCACWWVKRVGDVRKGKRGLFCLVNGRECCENGRKKIEGIIRKGKWEKGWNRKRGEGRRGEERRGKARQGNGRQCSDREKRKGVLNVNVIFFVSYTQHYNKRTIYFWAKIKELARENNLENGKQKIGNKKTRKRENVFFPFLGTKISFEARKPWTFFGAADMSIDDVTFVNCGLPKPRNCLPGEFKCIRRYCVVKDRVSCLMIVIVMMCINYEVMMMMIMITVMIVRR